LSLEERVHDNESVLLVGVGGGGDVSWSIPLINYLRTLGVKRFAVGEATIAWWDLEGRISLGGFTFHLADLDTVQKISDRCGLLRRETRVVNGPGRGSRLPQSIIAELKDVEAFALELDDGVVGMREGINALANHLGAGLVIGVDCGSDSFYSGTETKVLSPLVDAMIVAALADCKPASIMGLIGYGCDGDLMPDELDASVKSVIKKGGLLGARGLIPTDIQDMEKFFSVWPNPVEEWPLKAAKGELGWKNMNTLWSILVTPLTSIMMFFEPKVLVEHNPLANAVRDSKMLKEAEDAAIRMGLMPETRMAKLLPKLMEEE
jgi:hypothetical protein